MPAGLDMPVQGVHLQNEAVVFRAPLIFVIPILGLHLDLDNTLIHTGGNIGIVFLSFFFLCANVTTTDHYKYIQTNIETFRIV